MGGALTREAISTNYTITQIHPCQYFQLPVAVMCLMSFIFLVKSRHLSQIILTDV